MLLQAIFNTKNVAARTGKTSLSFKSDTQGGINLLVGPNGSGKSTALTAINEYLTGSGQGVTGYQSNPAWPSVYHSSEGYNVGHSEGNRLGGTYQSFGQRLAHLLNEVRHIHDPHIIMLDEPETALDFDTMYEFCRYISTNATKHQWIIATHHPLMFSLNNATFHVFGDDPNYHKKALQKMRKRLM